METKDLKEEFRRGAKYILRSDAEVCRSSQYVFKEDDGIRDPEDLGPEQLRDETGFEPRASRRACG